VKRLLIVTVVIALTLATAAPSASAAPAYAAATCADFPNQAAAQQAANTIDADHDGVYCVISPR